MSIVTIHEAKTNLSKLIARVEAGEEIVIARNKVAVARLTALPRKQELFGALLNRYKPIPDAFFFDPLPEDEAAAWEGGDASPR